jgi:hypothetical protein
MVKHDAHVAETGRRAGIVDSDGFFISPFLPQRSLKSSPFRLEKFRVG